MGMLSNSRFCKESYGKHLEIVKKFILFYLLKMDKYLILILKSSRYDKLEGNVDSISNE